MSFWHKSQAGAARAVTEFLCPTPKLAKPGKATFLALCLWNIGTLGCQPNPLSSEKQNLPESLPKLAVGSSVHCLEEHLQEAIALNSLRKDLYGNLTEGASLEISEQLIASEKSLLVLLQSMRPMLKYWWKRNILVTCLEFSPMAETPEFSPQFKVSPPAVSTVAWLDPLKVTIALQKKLMSDGLAGVENIARSELQALEYPDHFQCMSKHLLESIAKTAQVGEQLGQASKDKKILSSIPISYSLIQGQILNLGAAREIDEATFAIHQKGIPIICNDVPPIHLDGR